MIVLVTGPVRSGKSARAAFIARELGRPVTYVATARVDPTDAEMADRIARHRAERGATRTIEIWEPGVPDLPAVIAAADSDRTLLVDSLGTWIAGQMFDIEDLVERDAVAALAILERRFEPFIERLALCRGHVVVVAEETGWGLVPPSAQGRVFRDHIGRATRRVARLAERVELVVAGFAVDLKRYGTPIDA